MPVKWKFREWLKERGITRASEVSRTVGERTGYKLSIQAVCNLLNDQPKMIRIETMQALCDAFYCRLSDFFEVMPIAAKKRATKARGHPSVATSVYRELGQTESEPGDKQLKRRSGSPHTAKIDFAAFYPDAHKFSSRLEKND
jgi:DNA-binding Xre family transcriptional regulator